MNVERLRDLHGTGELTVRYIAKDSTSWKPTHTIFETTNYLSRIDESDHGTWRRLALVEFPYRYRQHHEECPTGLDRVGDLNRLEMLESSSEPGRFRG